MSDATNATARFHRPGWVEEFRDFIRRGSVVDLAVGIVIGAAFSAVVSSLVKDILTPVLGLLIGGLEFRDIFVTLKGPVAATLAEAQKAGAVTINIGLFFDTIIRFLIVSFAIFWLIKVLARLHRREEAPPAAPPPPPRSEILLEEIRDLLREKQPG